MQLWDNINKQWLIIMWLFLDDDGNLFHVRAHVKGESPLDHGWFDFKGEKLEHISINGAISHNPDMAPRHA